MSDVKFFAESRDSQSRNKVILKQNFRLEFMLLPPDGRESRERYGPEYENIGQIRKYSSFACR